MSTRKLLRRKAASDYLRETHGLERAPSTLAKLAVIGGGPIFRHAGRVPLYAPEDLDEWATSKLGPRMRSTSVAASVNPSVSNAAATAQANLRAQADAGA
jgi:hypothetical protein